MTEKLRLGPLPKTETAKLTITVTAALKADLDQYAELFSAAHGERVDAASLAPHMLAAFMDRDRAFRRSRQSVASANAKTSGSRSISAATSTTSEAAGDSSASA